MSLLFIVKYKVNILSANNKRKHTNDNALIEPDAKQFCKRKTAYDIRNIWTVRQILYVRDLRESLGCKLFSKLLILPVDIKQITLEIFPTDAMLCLKSEKFQQIVEELSGKFSRLKIVSLLRRAFPIKSSFCENVGVSHSATLNAAHLKVCHVESFVCSLLDRVIPEELMGAQNYATFKKNVLR